MAWSALGVERRRLGHGVIVMIDAVSLVFVFGGALIVAYGVGCAINRLINGEW